MDIQQLVAILQADVPVHMIGDPGCGKTQFAQALGRALNMPAHVEILSQCDPSDFGIPREQNGMIVRMPLKWVVEASEKPTMLVFDEFSLAPRGVLAACLTLIQDRHVAGRRLHNGTRILLASNPPEFTGTELLPQQANRMAHIQFEDMVPLAAWVRGMIAGFPMPTIQPLPEIWETLIPQNRALVASFAQRMPSEIFRRPKQLDGAWPSRRSWDNAARVSAACQALHVDDSLPIASLVGDGPALAYVGWRAQQDLPDPEEVLANPEKYKLPAEDERVFVVLSACAAAAVAKPDPKKWGACWVVLEKAVKLGKADIATVAAQVLATNTPRGAKMPASAKELLPILRQALR